METLLLARRVGREGLAHLPQWENRSRMWLLRGAEGRSLRDLGAMRGDSCVVHALWRRREERGLAGAPQAQEGRLQG